MQNFEEPFHFIAHRTDDGKAARALQSAMGRRQGTT